MAHIKKQFDENGCHVLAPRYMHHYAEGLVVSKMTESTQRRARFYNLVQILNMTCGVPGATAEAGCFRGLSSFLLCRTLRDEAADSQQDHFFGHGHFIVDSFEGLSEPTTVDGTRSHLRWEEQAFTDTSVEHVANTLKEFPEATILKGWIPDVLLQLPDQKYRFVHIDVDLYEPTKQALEYFYPRLSPGGAIVIDDFGPWPPGLWPGCAPAVKEFAKENKIGFASLNTGNAVLFKRI